ncbi:protein REGULATOR OF FATTY ACID COMPOSITION 3, chloroplastic-like [Rutidosis leptorrhynchoides]|uniref:protein REGULATOR OF FATTY ACID COMPOSITION 3, chloroplastic-like n=1 Tax=Rutidosis leptorrhynchoides TaxID=125765 RepID=UPI003A99D529
MESMVLSSSSSSSSILGFLERTHTVNLISRNGFGLIFPISSQNFRKSVVMSAKKNNTNNNNNNSDKKKQDRHSFIAKPDETTGVFPESVLLKQKVVQEDGKLLPEFADAEEQELYEALNLMLESDLDAEQNRHYEVVYLIHENFEEEVEKVNLKIQEFLNEKKGRVHRFSDWGLRRLAYKIQKAKNAHYILMNFEIEAKWINEFKTMLDKDERVIRHLVMKQDEAITEECVPPPEFHTLRADMDDDDDDDDVEEDDEYEEDDDDDDEGEIVSNDNRDDPGVIYVDEDEDEGDHRNVNDRKPASLKIGGRR